MGMNKVVLIRYQSFFIHNRLNHYTIFYNCFLFRLMQRKTSKLHIICPLSYDGDSTVTCGFPHKGASDVEMFSMSWCHHMHMAVPVDTSITDFCLVIHHVGQVVFLFSNLFVLMKTDVIAADKPCEIQPGDTLTQYLVPFMPIVFCLVPSNL